MSDPTISQAQQAYDLLLVLWDDPKMLKDWSWQHAVYEVMGPSTAPEFSVNPGDKVRLLVDGTRGKFKGEIGIVTGFDGNIAGIRVPGKIAPGETSEYCGPYHRSQFKLVGRADED
jgi:hypothetical protein